MLKFVFFGLLITALVMENTSGGVMDDIKKWGKETQDAITSKYKDLSGWTDAKMKEITATVTDKKEAIQKMAQEIIKDADSGVLQEKVANEAKDYFSKYKAELGDQYDKLMASINKRFGNSTEAASTDPAAEPASS